MKEIGKVTRFFDKISVAVILLKEPLTKGEKVKISGHGQEFEQIADSMQIDMKPIEKGEKGQEIALKTIQPVKSGAVVYKVE